MKPINFILILNAYKILIYLSESGMFFSCQTFYANNKNILGSKNFLIFVLFCRVRKNPINVMFMGF